MGGYITTVGTLIAMVVIATIVLNRHAAVGTIGQGIVKQTGNLAQLSTGGPGQ